LAIIEPAFLANVRTVVHMWSAGGIMLFVHYQKDGAERAFVDIVDIASMPFTFTLKQPAATPEAVNTTAADFPGWVRCPVRDLEAAAT